VTSRCGRGFDARISTEFDVTLPDSACVCCGNCIGVCPTGALMFASEYDMRQAGSWDESRQTVTTTICPYCGVGCNLELHVQDNRIVKVTSPLDHDVSYGHLCVKRKVRLRVRPAPDRGILSPLRRSSTGTGPGPPGRDYQIEMLGGQREEG
jgi:predicted molibdopterin-dependent oxidoreductase YjgC